MRHAQIWLLLSKARWLVRSMRVERRSSLLLLLHLLDLFIDLIDEVLEKRN